MPLKREELRHITATAAVGAPPAPALMTGSTVAPANMRRYIYKIKTVNEFAGANTLTLNRGSATVVGALIDEIAHAIQYDMWADPDELKKDSAPLYILEAAEGLWLSTDNGNCQVTIWYVDAE